MTNHTTAEIRHWHTELRQGNEDWYDLAGELLDRLEVSETKLEKYKAKFGIIGEQDE